MSRIKGTKSSAALIVAVVALVAALGGGAVAGVTISKLNKKERKQVKRLSKKQAKKLDRRIELLPGPQGDIGPQGPKGDPGDNVSALVRVAGATEPNPADADGEMVSTTITAPSDGQLMVVASVDAGAKPPGGAGVGADGFDCFVNLDGDSTEHGYNSVRVTYPDNGEEDCGTNVLLPVEAGQHELSFAANSVRTDDVALREARIQVLFVPT